MPVWISMFEAEEEEIWWKVLFQGIKLLQNLEFQVFCQISVK